MTPELLEWGALGLLAIVLGVIGKYLRDRDKMQQERDKAQQLFLQGLIKDSRDALATQVAIWQSSNAEASKVQAETVQAMKTLREQMETHIKQSSSRDRQVVRVLERLCDQVDPKSKS